MSGNAPFKGNQKEWDELVSQNGISTLSNVINHLLDSFSPKDYPGIIAEMKKVFLFNAQQYKETKIVHKSSLQEQQMVLQKEIDEIEAIMQSIDKE